MSDIKFVEGLRAYKPNQNAPDWIKANLVINVGELRHWLEGQSDDVRIDVKESKSGKWYCAVNDYKPQSKPQSNPKDEPFEDEYDEHEPFEGDEDEPFEDNEIPF